MKCYKVYNNNQLFKTVQSNEALALGAEHQWVNVTDIVWNSNGSVTGTYQLNPVGKFRHIMEDGRLFIGISRFHGHTRRRHNLPGAGDRAETICHECGVSVCGEGAFYINKPPLSTHIRSKTAETRLNPPFMKVQLVLYYQGKDSNVLFTIKILDENILYY
jgi:hypothetical protein